MLKSRCLFILYFLSFSAFGESLTCSRNNLKIIYINGIRVEKEGNDETKDNIQRIVNDMKSSLDQNSKVDNVIGFHNKSYGTFNDIAETKAQLSIEFLGKKRDEYWKEMARAEMMQTKLIHPGAFNREQIESKVESAFSQIYGQRMARNPKTKEINSEYFSKEDYYNVFLKYSPRLANILRMAASDLEVVQGLRDTIMENYKNGDHKILFIAHSQGNAVLKSAFSALYEPLLQSNLNLSKPSLASDWFYSTIGVMQVAPPTPTLITSNAEYMRINSDLVIDSSAFMTGVVPLGANYTVDRLTTVVRADGILNKLKSAMTINGISTGVHGMDDVYLSDELYAVNDKTGVSETLVNHFRDNLAKVALKMKGNCESLKPVKAECVVSSRPDGKLVAESLRQIFISSQNESLLPIDIAFDSGCGVMPLSTSDFQGIQAPFYSCLPRNSSGYFSDYSRYDQETISLHFNTFAGEYKKTINNPCRPGNIVNDFIVPL